MKGSIDSSSRKISGLVVFKYILQIVAIIIPVAMPFVSQALAQASINISTDLKLSTIGAGISLSLLSLGISINGLEKRIKENHDKISNRIDSVSQKIDQVNPVMEKVLLSENDRLQRFAFRRYDEFSKTINYALSVGNSGNLRPSEYYVELLYLADLIIKDKADNKQKFSGEIWAMTGFAEDEWICDEGYEKQWTEKLRELAKKHRIPTKRLCLIPSELENIIRKFSDKKEYKEKSFQQFMELLRQYYCDEEIKKTTEHFLIRASANQELEAINGFFAIKLTNGDLHILYGESGDANGSLTAKLSFDTKEISNIHNLFIRFATSNNRIEDKIREWSDGNGFIDYLKRQNINM